MLGRRRHVLGSLSFNQQPYHLHAVVRSCEDQRRRADARALVCVSPGLEQRAHHRSVPLLGRSREGAQPRVLSSRLCFEPLDHLLMK